MNSQHFYKNSKSEISLNLFGVSTFGLISNGEMLRQKSGAQLYCRLGVMGLTFK